MASRNEEKYKKVKAIHDNGGSATDECNKLNISPSAYYNWVRRKSKKKGDGRVNNGGSRKKKTRVETVSIPEKKESKDISVIVLKGDSDYVADTQKKKF